MHFSFFLPQTLITDSQMESEQSSTQVHFPQHWLCSIFPLSIYSLLIATVAGVTRLGSLDPAKGEMRLYPKFKSTGKTSWNLA